MPRIKFIGPALVDSGVDNEDGTVAITKDPAILKSLDGLRYEDEEFSEYLADDEVTSSISDYVSGGILEFEYITSDQALVGKVEYHLTRTLTSDEIQVLKEYTIEQLLDGIGSNFAQERMLNGEVTPILNNEELAFEQDS